MDLKITTLPETLSMINSAGLADEYRLLFKEYRDTGLFRKSTLAKIAKTTYSRYLEYVETRRIQTGRQFRSSIGQKIPFPKMQ